MKLKLFLIAALLAGSIFVMCTNPWMENLVGPIIKDKDEDKYDATFYVSNEEEWKDARFAIQEGGITRAIASS